MYYATGYVLLCVRFSVQVAEADIDPAKDLPRLDSLKQANGDVQVDTPVSGHWVML